METRCQNPFVDGAPFAELTWQYSNSSPLPPDELATFMESGSSNEFSKQPVNRRYCVQASAPHGKDLPGADGTTLGAPVALALFSLHSISTDPTIRRGAVVCILRGFAVDSRWQGLGLGKALFSRLHSYSFQLAHSWRRSWPSPSARPATVGSRWLPSTSACTQVAVSARHVR